MSIAWRGRWWFLILAILGGGTAVSRSLLLTWSRDPEQAALLAAVDPTSPKVRSLLQQRDKLIPLHQPMGEPLPDDWLAVHKEAGQTFAEYLSSQLEPPHPERQYIYVVPIGEMTATQERIVQRTGEFLAAGFGATVKFLPGIDAAEIPPEARRQFDESTPSEQWLSSFILQDLLVPLRPDDAIAVLGLTATDLWPAPGWNYVFGQASLGNRVGVWSLARNGDPDIDAESYRLCLRRTIKTALHETGHMLGIPHCTAYECGMNGSNSRDESDRRPLEFCPECQAKVWWALRVDPAQRCRRLADLAAEDGLDHDAQHWGREADVLRSRTSR
jgi:archaemetzincin